MYARIISVQLYRDLSATLHLCKTLKFNTPPLIKMYSYSKRPELALCNNDFQINKNMNLQTLDIFCQFNWLMIV